MIGTFLLFAAATIGFTHIIVDSTIFSFIRNWLKTVLPAKFYSAFECYQCAGTWCGFLAGLILISQNFFVIFMCGCAGSFLAVLGANLLNYLEAKSYVEVDDGGS